MSEKRTVEEVREANAARRAELVARLEAHAEGIERNRKARRARRVAVPLSTLTEEAPVNDRLYELYVSYANGDRYCEAESRDLRYLDREARMWLTRPGVVAVSATPRPARAGGYRRTR